MERGAFLRKPANSRTQLIAQLNSDPIVSARYQKHFAMSEDQVEQYFSGMRTSTLPSTGRYLVWHVDPDGKHETKWLTLKKGTKVFVDENGRVALKLNCGNPMVDQSVAKRTVTPPTRVATVAPTPVVEEAFVPEPPAAVALVPPPAVVVPEITAAAPPAPVVVESTPVIPPAAVVTAAPQRISGGGGFGILPLLIIGGAVVGGGGGGGGGGGVPPVVPEPATMVALGAGLLAVAARRRRAK